MREYAGNTANVFFTPNDDGTFRPNAELILLVSEVQYEPDLPGLRKLRRVETVRFGVGVEGLRQMAKRFSELADDIQEQADAMLAARERNEGSNDR